MSHPILASSLLRTAERLAGVGAGPGRPALSDLRRATSTAYYALFHQILRHGATDFLHRTATESDVAAVARWYTHGGILKAAELVLRADTPHRLEHVSKGDRTSVLMVRRAGDGVVPPRLVEVADTFGNLQRLRHEADYDGSYDPVRAATLSHVQSASHALAATRHLWRSGWVDDERRHPEHRCYVAFLRLALLASGGPRSR